jgi:ABC-type molybdate transport system permease subunit
MDHKTIIVMNCMAFTLLVPATIILAWELVSEKLKGKRASSELITGALILGSLVIGVTELNIDTRVGWLSWTFLVVQFILLVFLFKVLWSPLMQRPARVR